MTNIEPNDARQAIKEIEELMCDTVSIYRRDALGKAVAALELFIPEDVAIKPQHYFTGSCPVCGRFIERGTAHCPDCRQALRWPKGIKP